MPEYLRDWKTIDGLVGAIWRVSSPGGLFHNAFVAYHYRGVVSYGEQVKITEVSSDPEAFARDEGYLDWLRPRLAVHEGFVALHRHWAEMGVNGAYIGHDGYGGKATNWAVNVPKGSLPMLEQRAQDMMGLTSPERRAGRSGQFRRDLWPWGETETHCCRGNRRCGVKRN